MKRSRDVYAFGKVAFVPVASGLWIRTDVCVLKVACSACDAAKFEPCRSMSWVKRERVLAGPIAGTHYVRRRAARGLDLPGRAETLIHIAD